MRDAVAAPHAGTSGMWAHAGTLGTWAHANPVRLLCCGAGLLHELQRSLGEPRFGKKEEVEAVLKAAMRGDL